VAGRETGLLRHSLAPCHDTVRVCPSLLSEYFLSTHLVLHEQINTGPGWFYIRGFNWGASGGETGGISCILLPPSFVGCSKGFLLSVVGFCHCEGGKHGRAAAAGY
jgi:hypothetical protein